MSVAGERRSCRARSTRPISARSVVVLPTPLRPSSAVTPPSATSNTIPCRTCDSPRWTCRSWTSTRAHQTAPRGRPAAPSRCCMIASGVSTASSAAVVQHGDPLREPGHHLHVVLDHQHRLALVRVHRADQLDELRHVLHRDAGHRLVEQDHARVGRPAASRARACACRRARAGRRAAARGREPDAAERPVRPLHRVADAGRLPPDPHRPAERRLRGEPDVLEHRQQREHVRHLERAAEPGPGATERRLRP